MSDDEQQRLINWIETGDPNHGVTQVMSFVLIFPADRPGDATYASLAAQVEAGLVRVVQERRTSRDRREHAERWEHGQRGAQRRQATPLPVSARIVVTA